MTQPALRIQDLSHTFGSRQALDRVGITVNVNYYVPINGITGEELPDDYIAPGPDQHMDGYTALQFARGRYGLTDYDRMDRQRCAVKAIIDAADPVTLLSQYQGFADVQMGRGAIVIGLAAVVIGEAVFSKIFRNFALKLLSVGIGSIIYYIVMQICIWFKIDTDLLKMLSAIVVAIFLAVPYWKAKYFTRVAVKKGGSSNA